VKDVKHENGKSLRANQAWIEFTHKGIAAWGGLAEGLLLDPLFDNVPYNMIFVIYRLTINRGGRNETI